MKNEFGVKLDSNGYAPSIVQEDHSKCYICECHNELQRHEPFNGSNRTKSKNLGMWVTLCRWCHEMAHRYPDSYGEAMKRETQSRAMLHYEWDYDDWRQRFGKSVL